MFAKYLFRIIYSSCVVKGFTFADADGFDETIDIDEIRGFVERLAKYMRSQY
jgi:hypothetical protein